MTRFAAKHSKFGVGGCCRLDLFSLQKIFFAKFFYTLRIILKASVLFLSEKYAQRLRKMKYE